MDLGTVQFAVYYNYWPKSGGQANATLPSAPLPSSKLLTYSSTRGRRSSSFNKFVHRAIFGISVEKQPLNELDYGPTEQKEGENLILTRAISNISTSQTLPECETAIRVMTKAWLDNPLIEKTLSNPSVIEGMLQVLFASNNEEILELVISLLTEFVSRNESNRNIILNLDPELDGFMNLMKNSNLFLKAASLLHLVKPESKQMISVEWIPLVLRVLEFGDQMQTLFSVRCSPQAAAYYFLDQLLNGFDQDRNLENGRQVISLGGLSLLLRRMASGDNVEKTNVVSVIYCCIQADGRCRHYLADNLNTDHVLELLVQNKENDCNDMIFSFLLELICLHRFEQRSQLFNKLLKGWNCLNTMQILLVSLQRVKLEKRSLVAAIMIQLDLMGDPLKSSVYRDEAIDAIIEAFNPHICNEDVQEHAAKALLILGSKYAYMGTPETEKWILKEAGYNESLEGGFHGRYVVFQESKQANEDNEIERWQRKAATALWISGGKRLIGALGESIANGIPCLARASLVTVAWMSKFVHTVGEGDVLESNEFSTLLLKLSESLSRDNTIEERVIASFSLLALSKCSGFLLGISDDMKSSMMINLRNISKVTWTAKRLAATIAESPTRS